MMYMSKSQSRGCRPMSGSVHGRNIKGDASTAIPLCLITASVLFSCSDANKDDDVECHANVDCAGTSACVDSVCIDDPAECSNMGVFVDVFETQPQNADKVDELHVTLDETGAAHYCYHGTQNNKPVSYYGYQTAWNTFVEESLKIGEWDAVRCGALTVTPEGVPFFLLREPAGVVYRVAEGAWAYVELRDLTGLEPSGALKGSRTLISLTPDKEGGVYLGLSLGFELGSQPIYLAHVKQDGSLQTLVNGWSDNGEYSATGHAPQFVMSQTGAEMIMGRLLSFKVLKADTNLEITAEQEGAYPRATVDSNGNPFVAYMDHNKYLHLDRVVGDGFQPFARIGKVEIPENGDGQIPWDVAFDVEDTAHFLIEDGSQGRGTLVYRSVDFEGHVSSSEIIGDELSDHLSGMQLYAIVLDICNRATVSYCSNSSDKNSRQELPTIVLTERR